MAKSKYKSTFFRKKIPKKTYPTKTKRYPYERHDKDAVLERNFDRDNVILSHMKDSDFIMLADLIAKMPVGYRTVETSIARLKRSGKIENMHCPLCHVGIGYRVLKSKKYNIDDI